jgi:hypothetical protein
MVFRLVERTRLLGGQFTYVDKKKRFTALYIALLLSGQGWQCPWSIDNMIVEETSKRDIWGIFIYGFYIPVLILKIFLWFMQ